MSEVTKVVSAENAPINSSMNYAKKYEASYEDSGGSGGGAFIVHATWGDTQETEDICTLDKTYSEIVEAAKTQPVVCVETDVDGEDGAVTHYVFSSAYPKASGYCVLLMDFSVDSEQKMEFLADSANGVLTYTYPTGN